MARMTKFTVELGNTPQECKTTTEFDDGDVQVGDDEIKYALAQLIFNTYFAYDGDIDIVYNTMQQCMDVIVKDRAVDAISDAIANQLMSDDEGSDYSFDERLN